MICEHCQGRGVIREWLSLMGGEIWADRPCQECHGAGIVACCEGAPRQLENGEAGFSPEK